MKTSIKFINHASVIIGDGEKFILSDPWYSGEAFHKGWNLLYETKETDVEEILTGITHIWISHEHPDHFSVPFFKKFAIIIKEKSIKMGSSPCRLNFEVLPGPVAVNGVAVVLLVIF